MSPWAHNRYKEHSSQVESGVYEAMADLAGLKTDHTSSFCSSFVTRQLVGNVVMLALLMTRSLQADRILGRAEMIEAKREAARMHEADVSVR